MATKRMLVDATHPEETRIVVTSGNRLEEFDFESASRRQLRGNIYLAKVTRVEPSLQAAFVDYGGNRHGFLAFSEIHPDYYQIPVADREALLAMEAEANERINDDNGGRKSKRRNKKTENRSKPEAVGSETEEDVIGDDDEPDVIAAGNIGCIKQIASGIGVPVISRQKLDSLRRTSQSQPGRSQPWTIKNMSSDIVDGGTDRRAICSASSTRKYSSVSGSLRCSRSTAAESSGSSSAAE